MTKEDLRKLLQDVRRVPGMYFPGEAAKNKDYHTLVGFVGGLDIGSGRVLLGHNYTEGNFNYFVAEKLGHARNLVWWYGGNWDLLFDLLDEYLEESKCQSK